MGSPRPLPSAALMLRDKFGSFLALYLPVLKTMDEEEQEAVTNTLLALYFFDLHEVDTRQGGPRSFTAFDYQILNRYGLRVSDATHGLADTDDRLAPHRATASRASCTRCKSEAGRSIARTTSSRGCRSRRRTS